MVITLHPSRSPLSLSDKHQYLKQSSLPNFVSLNKDFVDLKVQSSGGAGNNGKALKALSDYQTVHDLIFRQKQQKDVPALKGALLTAEDMDAHPQVMRNIYMALGERYLAEAKKLDASPAKLGVKQSKELAEAYRVIADGCQISAAAIKPLSKAEKLKFGTRPYNGKTFEQRFRQANGIIHSYAAGAGAAGFWLSPIPLAGPLGLTFITNSMLKKLGRDLYNRNIGWGPTGLAHTFGAVAGPSLANQLLSFIPGIGPAVVAASEGASSALMHEAFGWFFFSLFESQIKNGGHPGVPHTLSSLGTAFSIFKDGLGAIGTQDPAAFMRLIDDVGRRFNG